MFLIRLLILSIAVRCCSSSPFNIFLTKYDTNNTKENITESQVQGRSLSSAIETKNAFLSATSSLLDLAALAADLISPYLDFSYFNFQSFQSTIQSFKATLAKIDPTSNPITVFVVGAGAVIGPYIYQLIQNILYGLYEFVDNAYFATTGEALQRSGISDDLVKNLLEETVKHITK